MAENEVKTPEVMLREVEANVTAKLEKSIDDKLDANTRQIIADLTPKIQVVGPASEMRAVADAMIQMSKGEKRSLTLSGAGAYNVLKSFEKIITEKHDIVSKAKWFYGAGAQTNIPVFTARPARPIKQAEGATGIGGDATAAQSVKSLTPYAYYSEIFVSAENIVQGAASVEGVLPELFGEAFANALHYGMVVGDSTMVGLFADAALTNDTDCAAVGHPTWTDFVRLAAKLRTKAFSPVMVTCSEFYADLLLSTEASFEGLKMELMTKGSIAGIPLIVDGFAPSTHADGDIVAVGLDLQNYGIVCAREFQIEPIRAPGTAGVYFQATGFYNGAPIIAANGWQLEAA